MYLLYLMERCVSVCIITSKTYNTTFIFMTLFLMKTFMIFGQIFGQTGISEELCLHKVIIFTVKDKLSYYWSTLSYL